MIFFKKPEEDQRVRRVRSSPSEVFLGKGVLKICRKFAGEHPCRSAISIKLLCNFIEIALRHGLCIKPAIQERGTECGECGKWGECYIAGNIAKHSGECPQTFPGMLSNILGNVLKHSRECRKTFRGMS